MCMCGAPQGLDLSLNQAPHLICQPQTGKDANEKKGENLNEKKKKTSREHKSTNRLVIIDPRLFLYASKFHNKMSQRPPGEGYVNNRYFKRSWSIRSHFKNSLRLLEREI